MLGTALLVSLGGMGCAPLHNGALEQARTSYLQAQHDPDIVTYAWAPPRGRDDAPLSRGDVGADP